VKVDVKKVSSQYNKFLFANFRTQFLDRYGYREWVVVNHNFIPENLIDVRVARELRTNVVNLLYACEY